MIRAARPIMLGIALASWLGVGVAVAGSLVEFPNVSEHAPKLTGYLARPDAGLSALAGRKFDRVGPYPAVVVLHGCGGISSHSTGIADRLGSWGYVALAVDSLSPRGIISACGGGSLGQAFDAYAALRYLTTLEDVDPARIAVLGQSMGAGSALYALDRDLGAQYFTERFRVAILYYPGCGTPGANLTGPTLILIGDKDDWTPADRCRDLVVRARSDGAPITLHVYPGVHHAFDVVQLRPGIRNPLGHWLEYDEAAAQDAEQRVRAFLARHLARAASALPAVK
jgi:dienelactone hydrolase